MYFISIIAISSTLISLVFLIVTFIHVHVCISVLIIVLIVSPVVIVIVVWIIGLRGYFLLGILVVVVVPVAIH